MSENLKKIVDNGALENTVDVVTVASLVTQLADSLNGFQGNESEVHTYVSGIICYFHFPQLIK